MEVLFGLFVLAFALAGPVAFFLALSQGRRIRELEAKLRKFETKARADTAADSPGGESTAGWMTPLGEHETSWSPDPAKRAKVPREPLTPISWNAAPDSSAFTAPESERSEPWSEKASETSSAPPSTADSVAPIPEFASTTPAVEPKKKKVEDWEQYVGGSLLNRIGVTLLVLGIAFALGYTFNQLDAIGKAILANVVSIALILTGCVLERRVSFQYQARGLIAGGWAALYVTAYAMHGLEATRVIDDVRVAFLVLLLVGGGMIVHSLRYSQQSVTAIAYSLAYAAIVVHSIHAYTLAASILLGAGTLLHLFRRNWRNIAFLGLGASYGSILLWYQRQASIDAAALHLALGAIGVNWLVYLCADLRTTGNDRDKIGAWANATFAVLLATAVYVESTQAGRYLPALFVGIAYVATAVLGTTRGLPIASSIHPILGAAALGYSAWLGLELRGATWVWLAEAEIAFLIGLWRGDARLRRFGALAFLAPLLGLIADELPRRLAVPALDFPGTFDFGTLLFTLTAWHCLQFSSLRLRKDAAKLPDSFDSYLANVLSHLSLVIVALALYVQLPSWTLAPAAAVLAMLHFELGRAWSRSELVDQAVCLGTVACISALTSVVAAKAQVWGIDARILTGVFFALPMYALVIRARIDRAPELSLSIAKHLFSWATAFIVFILIRREAPHSMIGVYTAAMAAWLVYAGARFDATFLRKPGYFHAACAIPALLTHNVSSSASWEGLPVGLATTLPALGLLSATWWWVRQLAEPPFSIRRDGIDEVWGRALGYGIVVTMFSLLGNRLEALSPLHLLPLFIVGLELLGRALRDADFRWMSRIAAIMLIAAVTFSNDATLGELFGCSGSVALVLTGTTALVIVGVLERRFAANPRVDRRTLGLETQLARIPDLSFLIAIAVTVIHVGRTREGFGLSVGWALEGLLATIAGFALKARGLRLGGLFVLGLALVVTLYRAFTTFDTVGRIISFLVLGGVLVLLSLAYAKRRENEKKPPDATSPETDRDAA